MAKPKDKQPWFKFYPQDWRGDAKLRMCSVGARGLWAEMLCVMHEAEPYGYLLSNGNAVTSRQMAALAGISQGECMKYMLELASAGVYSIDDDKTIYSRRMVRDKAKAEQAKTWGKGGGNPDLVGGDKGGVNPPDKGMDKPQKPSSRSHIPESAAAAGRLDENGTRQETALKALFVSTRSSLGWSIPNMDQIAVWLLAGIPYGTISSAVLPMLRRKEDMVSLVYCDGAVREAHAAAPHLQQVVSNNVWVDEGTEEWNSHQTVAFEKTGRGTPITDHRDEDNRRTGRRGWYFASKWAEGFNDFGERIPPSSDEAAA